MLDLASPGCGPAADLLRDHGFWLGGLLPRWFDGDGLLMQKSLDRPNFAAVETYSEEAQSLLQLIEDDFAASAEDFSRAA